MPITSALMRLNTYKNDNMKTLDTRDLNDRKIELEGYRDALDTARALLAEAETEQEKEQAQESVELAEIDFGEAEAEELAELEELESEISEWRHGETLILVSDFVDYVEEMLKDCGDLPKDIPWYIAIDWQKTADNIAIDYSIVTYQGQDYYVRS